MSIFELSVAMKEHSIKPAKRATPKSNTQQSSSKSPEDLEKMAMEAMEDLSEKFPAWASGDVQKMKQLLVQAADVFGMKRTQIIRQQLYPKAHDLKGQGTTFGYPLITDIGTHMCRLITEKTTFSADDLAILKTDTLMLETVLWKKLKGDGGKKGTEILEKLK